MIAALALAATTPVLTAQEAQTPPVAAPAAESPSEQLHYSMGGLTSTPIELDIDLTSGDFALEEGVAGAPGAPPTKRRGRIDRASLAHIRQIAANGVRMGFETAACRRAEERGQVMMPIMDALPNMSVQLGGRWIAAPVNIGCWTPAANALAGAAYDAVHRPG